MNTIELELAIHKANLLDVKRHHEFMLQQARNVEENIQSIERRIAELEKQQAELEKGHP